MSVVQYPCPNLRVGDYEPNLPRVIRCLPCLFTVSSPTVSGFDYLPTKLLSRITMWKFSVENSFWPEKFFPYYTTESDTPTWLSEVRNPLLQVQSFHSTHLPITVFIVLMFRKPVFTSTSRSMCMKLHTYHFSVDDLHKNEEFINNVGWHPFRQRNYTSRDFPDIKRLII